MATNFPASLDTLTNPSATDTEAAGSPIVKVARFTSSGSWTVPASVTGSRAGASGYVWIEYQQEA